MSGAAFGSGISQYQRNYLNMSLQLSFNSRLLGVKITLSHAQIGLLWGLIQNF